jgi:rare lipoprotein A
MAGAILGERKAEWGRASVLDIRDEVRQSERVLIETAREKRIQRRGGCGAALLLVAVAGLVGCGAPQTARNGSRAPVGGATAEQATGAALEEGKASYYSDKLAGRPTAHGEAYDPRAFTAAHRTLPFGTMVYVARPDGRHVTVRINDRGPFKRGRVIDLSRRAAEQIGLVKEGVGEVSLRVVSLPPGK